MFGLSAGLAGQSRAVVDVLTRWTTFTRDPGVDTAMVDDKSVPFAEWSKLVPKAKTDAYIFWSDRDKQIGYRTKSDIASFYLPDGFSTIEQALAIVQPLPFDICSLGTVYEQEWLAAKYPRWGFGRSHIDHGWGCAFRGAGHDRLVSRRWLDFGPWRVIRRDKDTTFIQFHDLDITDPAEAYEQAKVGHQRMGIAPDGGYIAWHYENLLTGAAKFPGLFTPINATKEIVVAPGIEVTQGQMICQTALRLHHNLTQPKSNRIRHVAYVFMDRADAEAHLHQLWLRELQCWYVDGSGKHRLDAGYKPTPNPPDWVKRLNARDGTK
jgi:hypothetical protein